MTNTPRITHNGENVQQAANTVMRYAQPRETEQTPQRIQRFVLTENTPNRAKTALCVIQLCSDPSKPRSTANPDLHSDRITTNRQHLTRAHSLNFDEKSLNTKGRKALSDRSLPVAAGAAAASHDGAWS